MNREPCWQMWRAENQSYTAQRRVDYPERQNEVKRTTVKLEIQTFFNKLSTFVRSRLISTNLANRPLSSTKLNFCLSAKTWLMTVRFPLPLFPYNVRRTPSSPFRTFCRLWFKILEDITDDPRANNSLSYMFHMKDFIVDGTQELIISGAKYSQHVTK